MSDSDDKKTSSSHKKNGVFGEGYIEHKNKDGGVTGSSHKKKGLWGNDYVEHRNKDGGVTGTSHNQTGVFNDYTEHRNTDGGTTSTTTRSTTGGGGGGGAISGGGEDILAGLGGCLAALVLPSLILWLMWGNISRKYEKLYPDLHFFSKNTSHDEAMRLANLEFTYWFLNCIDRGSFFMVYEACADEIHSPKFYFDRLHKKSVRFVEKQRNRREGQLPHLLKATERQCRKAMTIGTANYRCVQYRVWHDNILIKNLHVSSEPVHFIVLPYKHSFHPGPFLPIKANQPWKIDENPVMKIKKTNTQNRPKPVISEQTRSIQMRLAQLGYAVGKPDGISGPNTTKAIRQFQKDHGYPVTGTPTRELLLQIANARE